MHKKAIFTSYNTIIITLIERKSNMNEKTELQLKAAIADALSTICRKDDNGVFYREIYADYQEKSIQSTFILDGIFHKWITCIVV